MMMDSLLYGDLVDPFFPVAPEEDEEKEKTTDQPSEKELEKMTRKVCNGGGVTNRFSPHSPPRPPHPVVV